LVGNRLHPCGFRNTLIRGRYQSRVRHPCGSSLGRAVSLALVDSSVNVTVIGRREHALADTVELAAKSPGRILALPTDLRHRESVGRAFDAAEAAE
jgi:NADP-dependent 3-hydroxy acid dehydrogenase YdfG